MPPLLTSHPYRPHWTAPAPVQHLCSLENHQTLASQPLPLRISYDLLTIHQRGPHLPPLLWCHQQLPSLWTSLITRTSHRHLNRLLQRPPPKWPNRHHREQRTAQHHPITPGHAPRLQDQPVIPLSSRTPILPRTLPPPANTFPPRSPSRKNRRQTLPCHHSVSRLNQRPPNRVPAMTHPSSHPTPRSPLATPRQQQPALGLVRLELPPSASPPRRCSPRSHPMLVSQPLGLHRLHHRPAPPRHQSPFLKRSRRAITEGPRKKHLPKVPPKQASVTTSLLAPTGPPTPSSLTAPTCQTGSNLTALPCLPWHPPPLRIPLRPQVRPPSSSHYRRR